MNKKALSAFLAMSSMAGVMAPSMTAFAAEENKNTVEDLITYAKNAKDLYHYNQAYAAIMADKDNANFNTWLGELAPVAKEIKGYDEMMKIIAEIQDEVQKNQSIEQYNAVVAKVQSLFDNGSICKTDKEYLDAELVYWTRTPIFTTQSDLTKVIDKTNEAAQLLADGKAVEAQTAIQAAQAILAGENNINEVNEAYLKTNTVEPVAKNIAEAVAKLPVQVQEVQAINAKELKVVFTEPVDDNTAKNTKNYAVTINGTTYNDSNAQENQRFSHIVDAANTVYNKADNSVIFRFNNNEILGNGDKYTVDVKDGIYSADKSKKVEMFKGAEKQFNDSVAPQLVSTELTGDNLLKLTFNEPVSSIGSVTIDGINVTNGIAAANAQTILQPQEAGKYTVTIPASNLPNAYDNGELAKKLIAEGTHNVVVYKASDVAAQNYNVNTANILKSQYTVTATSEVPSVKSIETVDDNSRAFDITFDRNVTTASLQNGLEIKKGLIKILNNQNPASPVATQAPTFKVIPRDDDNNNDVLGADKAKVFRIQISANGTEYNLYDDDATTVDLTVKIKGYSTEAGYIGAETVQNVTLSKESAVPTLDLDNCKVLGQADNQAIYLEFKKAIKNLDTTKLIVTDKDGVNRTIDTAKTQIGRLNGNVFTQAQPGDGADVVNNVIKIALQGFNANYDDKAPYTVTVESGAVQSAVPGIVDKIVNNQEVVTVNKESGVVAPVYVMPVGAITGTEKAAAISDQSINGNGFVMDTITVAYGTKMAASAANLANYTLDGAALPAGTKITMNESDTTVTITLPDGYIQNTGKHLLEISKNVQTDDGSMVVADRNNDKAVAELVNVVDNTKPVMESAKYLVSNVSKDNKTNAIQVKFSEDMATIAEANENSKNFTDDFKVYVNGTEVTVLGVQNSKENENELNLILDKQINTNQSTVIKVIPQGTDNQDGIKVTDVCGNQLSTNANTVTVDGTVQGEAKVTVAEAKIGLDAALEQAKQYNGKEAEYTVDTWATFTQALNAANALEHAGAIVEGTTVEQIQTATTNLNNAMEKLVTKAAAQDVAVKAVDALAGKDASGLTLVQLNATGVNSATQPNLAYYQKAIQAAGAGTLNTQEAIQNLVNTVNADAIAVTTEIGKVSLTVNNATEATDVSIDAPAEASSVKFTLSVPEGNENVKMAGANVAITRDKSEQKTADITVTATKGVVSQTKVFTVTIPTATGKVTVAAK